MAKRRQQLRVPCSPDGKCDHKLCEIYWLGYGEGWPEGYAAGAATAQAG